MSDKSDFTDFLKVKDQFQLGMLITESANPITQNLSQYTQKDVVTAIDLLKQVDIAALNRFLEYIPKLSGLHKAIQETLEQGGKIFMGGCGATGRLSLVCEFIWRWQRHDSPLKDQIIAFMAGGDVALISSIEKFEDFPEFGARQLRELGFQENDLFIGTTEGGETPFVIGATVEATKISKRKPWFLYCNPDEMLVTKIVRSREVIQNPKIEKINLTVGPMSITGSTRMQASTVLMYALGVCLDYHDQDFQIAKNRIRNFVEFYKKLDLQNIAPLVEAEASHYQNGGLVFYEPSNDLAIAVLTDTTERSPTFSLSPFENELDHEKKASLCYLVLSNKTNSQDAWHSLLMRGPRVLNWPEITNRTTAERLWGFDLSHKIVEKRRVWHHKTSLFFKIFSQGPDVVFSLGQEQVRLHLDGLDFLERHLVVKMVLNSLSTAIMGRLGRYEGNVMTWVRSSNFKLIDRTIRYVSMILERDGYNVDYDKTAELIFGIKDDFPSDKPLVLEIVKRTKSRDLP